MISTAISLAWNSRIASSLSETNCVSRSIDKTSAIRTLLWMAVFVLCFGAKSASAVDQPSGSPRLSANPSSQGGSTASLASSGTNTSYVLSANDLIRVEVYKEDDLRTLTRVDQDGTVFLPLVETVKLGGRTVAEARDVVRQLYEKDYLKAAHVTITLVESSQTNVLAKPKALKFTILGEVKKPGNIEMPEGEKLDIVRAIGMAEGFTGLANKRSVTVNRKGDPKPHDVDVQALTRDPKAKPFEVKPGDVIEVRQTIF
jgi:polysaccharide export outer membrane protein